MDNIPIWWYRFFVAVTKTNLAIKWRGCVSIYLKKSAPGLFLRCTLVILFYHDRRHCADSGTVVIQSGSNVQQL